MKIILYLVFAINGLEPKEYQQEMPDLKTCYALVDTFLTGTQPKDLLMLGGSAQGSCVVVYPTPPEKKA